MPRHLSQILFFVFLAPLVAVSQIANGENDTTVCAGLKLDRIGDRSVAANLYYALCVHKKVFTTDGYESYFYRTKDSRQYMKAYIWAGNAIGEFVVISGRPSYVRRKDSKKLNLLNFDTDYGIQLEMTETAFKELIAIQRLKSLRTIHFRGSISYYYQDWYSNQGQLGPHYSVFLKFDNGLLSSYGFGRVTQGFDPVLTDVLLDKTLSK